MSSSSPREAADLVYHETNLYLLAYITMKNYFTYFKGLLYGQVKHYLFYEIIFSTQVFFSVNNKTRVSVRRLGFLLQFKKC